MYDELIKDLREWPRICIEYTGSLEELHDKAADAIEELQKRISKVPHGRLIDADALMKLEVIPSDNWVFRAIEKAPTVIEAEEQSGNSGELED